MGIEFAEILEFLFVRLRRWGGRNETAAAVRSEIKKSNAHSFRNKRKQLRPLYSRISADVPTEFNGKRVDFVLLIASLAGYFIG